VELVRERGREKVRVGKGGRRKKERGKGRERWRVRAWEKGYKMMGEKEGVC